MTLNPFVRRRSQQAGVNTRRSTRVDHVCAVVVSGRDSAGAPFREETETSAVNLHGCKLKLNHQVLVGMVVSLETPHAKSAAKAICVHVWEPERGRIAREVAFQLLKPQNVWGLKDPPADWEQVAETLVKGHPAIPVPSPAANAAPPPTANAPKPAVSPALADPQALTSASTPSPVPAPPRSAASEPAKTPAAAVASEPGASPAALVAAEAPPPPAGSALAELEDRSWQLMDSVLQVLRDQTDELVHGSLEEFRQQVDASVTDAEARLKRRAEDSYGDLESSINRLRSDLAKQLTQRTQEIVESAKAAVHAKMEEIFSVMRSSSQGNAANPPSKK